MAFRDARAKQAPAARRASGPRLADDWYGRRVFRDGRRRGAAGESAAAARAGVCLFRHWKSEPDGLFAVYGRAGRERAAAVFARAGGTGRRCADHDHPPVEGTGISGGVSGGFVAAV